MAVNDYYNRGRVEGVQKSDALDTLERLLGIGQGVADNIQKNRDRRSNSFLVRINSILDAGDNQEAIHKRTFNNDLIKQSKERLIREVGNGINRTNLETRELYNQYIKEMDREMELNTAFLEDKKSFSLKESEFLNNVQKYIDNQGKDGFDAQEQMQKITDNINTYSSSKIDFLSKYGNKAAYDTQLMGDMSSFVFSAQKFLGEVRAGSIGDTAMIPEPLHRMLITGLASDNLQLAQSAVNQYDRTRAGVYESKFAAAERDIVKYEGLTTASLNEYGLFVSDPNQTGDWAGWPKFQQENEELEKAYNKYYQISNSRHVNDPLHSGNIDDYREILINEYKMASKLLNKKEKGFTAEELRDDMNAFLNSFQLTSAGTFMLNGRQIPSRAWQKAKNKFQDSVIDQVTGN